MCVRITALAEADLEDIADHFAKDSPLRAVTFVAELHDQCLRLGEHSERYQVFATRLGRDMRRCPYKSYLIF